MKTSPNRVLARLQLQFRSILLPQPVPPLSRRRGNLPADPVPPIPQKSAPPCRPSLPGPNPRRELQPNCCQGASCRRFLYPPPRPDSSSRLLQLPSPSPSRTSRPSCQNSAPPLPLSPSTAQPTPELRQLHHLPPSPNPRRDLVGRSCDSAVGVYLANHSLLCARPAPVSLCSERPQALGTMSCKSSPKSISVTRIPPPSSLEPRAAVTSLCHRTAPPSRHHPSFLDPDDGLPLT